MRVRAGLVGDEEWSAGAEVGVVAVKVFGVEGREVVGEFERLGVEFEEAVAVVATASVDVEAAVASGYDDVAVGVGGGTGVGGPDATVVGVGRGVEDGALLEGVGVVGDDPAVVGGDVAGASPGERDGVVGEEQGGARVFMPWVEGKLAAFGAVSFAGEGGFDFYGAVEFLCSVGDGEGVEGLLEVVFGEDVGAILGAGEDVEGAGGRIDDGGGGDADFGTDEGAGSVTGGTVVLPGLRRLTCQSGGPGVVASKA